MPLAFTYPLNEKIYLLATTFLGITFNYGLILVGRQLREINLIPIILYIGAIFWTLGLRHYIWISRY